MPDMEKVKKGIFEMLQRDTWKDIDPERIRFQPVLNDALSLLEEQEYKDRMFHALEDDWKAMLKEQEAVKPRVSSVEQRCGNCNKVIEMDGWKACPWCGKMIDWERR